MARNKASGKAKAGKGRGRKSRAEDATGAKEATVEVRKGELELKPVEINDGDFDLHLRAMKSAVERQKTAKNLYDGCCKAAKKVSEHLLNSVKLAIKYEGMDIEDIKADLTVKGYVLKKTGSPVQITLHDVLAGDVNKAAYERGKNDALNGRGCKPPYPEGSDLAEEYNTGWRNGIGSNLGLTEAETEAAVMAGPEDEDEDEAPHPEPEAGDDGDAPAPIREPQAA